MNSALQCLVNCEALADYFLGFDWQAEINRYVSRAVDCLELRATTYFGSYLVGEGGQLTDFQ